MVQFFGISIDTLTTILLVVTCVIVVAVILLALANLIFFKIGVRNISRRRSQMLLIVFALMLSTTLLSSVLATGDVMTSAVQSVAVYNWGNIDELIEGGRGPIGLYSVRVYNNIRSHLKETPDISAVAAALRERDLLIADQTSRQVRSKVTALGVLPDSELGLGGLQDATTKRDRLVKNLPADRVYLNQTLATLLNAKPNDTIYLYSDRWPGRRYTVHVAAIVNDTGIVGDNPYIVGTLQKFQEIEKSPNRINQIFISNRGGGGVNGLGLSDQVSEQLEHRIPRYVHVIQVKQQGVADSLKAQDIFSRIFSLFALFALAIGLLLIFLIFVLLAAERRSEMGIARAIGVGRGHLVLMFLFEGSVYDLLSSFIGVLFGVGVGALIVYLLGPILERFNFPLKFSLQPHSLIVAYCLGVIFTFFSVALSSWLVSRMTVIEALRDLPEPARSTPSPGELGERAQRFGRQFVETVFAPKVNWRRLRRIMLELLPDVLIGGIQLITMSGILPLAAGFWLLQWGLSNLQIIPFSLGLSLLVVGLGLLLKALLLRVVALVLWLRKRENVNDSESMRRWSRALEGMCVALSGLALVAYWALPFDVLQSFGLPRFQGGIELFFVAGVMMVLGAVWALSTNARLIIAPFLALCAGIPGVYVLTKLAVAYPLHRRFRTGLSVVMFSLVVFAMTVMAVITNAMQNTYVDIDQQTGGYDIQATAYFKSLPDLQSSLAQHNTNPRAFAAIGVRNTTVMGVIQLGAQAPRWSLYPTQVVSGGFLQGYGIHLTARANGFANDAEVWHALQTHPDYALIDSSALPYPYYAPPVTPPSFDARYTFALSGVYQGDRSFPAVPIWTIGIDGKQTATTRLTIIGVVDNSDSAHFGLYVSRAAYSKASAIADTAIIAASNTPQAQSYYFKVAPGQDKRALALALGSAYLDNGLETTVLEDAIWQVRGPRILLSNVLLGVVGMTLLLGVAALALTGTRAVIERRQQIGMLRAMGTPRLLIQGAFLLESFLVGAVGSILGCILGLILARNIFAANFFEQYQTGLFFSVPWQELVLIVVVSFLASFLGAVLPAWQAGRIAPAEALRYS
ncbi:MAG: hypothetical protein PVS3B1_08850 [Ktedonobacteraceae bacterium]